MIDALCSTILNPWRWMIPVFLACLLLVGCTEKGEKGQETKAVSQQPIEENSRTAAETTAMPSVTKTAVATLTVIPTGTPLPTETPSPTATATPAFPIYDGNPLDSDSMGIQIHIHREDIESIIDDVQDLGMGWVKVQVSWKLYQSAPDQYTEDRLAELDRLVEAAAVNNIKVLLSVSKAPEWSRPTTDLDGPPLDYDLYREFMAFLAGRYQNRVAAYELWNEPNLRREWNGSPLDAADLVRLIAAGAEGIRQSDPNALLISGAPATTGINDGIAAIDDRVFMRAMLKAGVDNRVDAVGVHPYGWANSPDSTVSQPDPAVPSHNNHPSFFFADTLTDYTALLDEYSASIPLWVTEFGWGSFEGILNDEGDPASPPAGADFMVYLSEWQQAQYIMRAFEIGQESSKIGPMILWNLNFAPLLGHEFSESGYSILRPDGSPRPSHLSLQAESTR